VAIHCNCLNSVKSTSKDSLKELREDRAFSVWDLVEVAGISTDNITALEKGRRKAWPRNVRKLALALSVDPREWMKGGGDA
jgi:transcriptional regulator with XRE-family HTH domain